jgi:hypothetical protein
MRGNREKGAGTREIRERSGAGAEEKERRR